MPPTRPAPPSPGQRQRLDALMRGGHHLLALINDVLDVARIEAGHLQLTPEPVDLARLLRDALALVQPMAQARGVVLAAPAGLGAGAGVADTAIRWALHRGQRGQPGADAGHAGASAGHPPAPGRPARGTDLVRLDIQWPVTDGFEVPRRLRQPPALRHLPVVAASASAMPDGLAEARAAGVADGLAKPLDMARRLAVVDRMLA
jgi:CheY-like chemotaxis protein